MKKGLLLSFLMFFVLVSGAWAQAQTVTGRVTSAANGQALPGVTVLEKGTTNGVTTGVDGDFRLNVQPNATLVFRFIGMTTQEVPVSGRSTINIALEADQKLLKEVVVVGYGTQERREVTGATAKVTSETIQDLPVVGVDQALQGRAAGVQISQNSGTPGAGISVRVRGSSSISASNQPLYVVDGVPLTSGDYSQLGYGGQSVNAISDLNPNDIESIDVLKDASAAAIYGSRAANGVVLITTKRGSARKTQINFNAYTGTQSMWKKPDFLNAAEYREIMAEAYRADAGPLDFPANGDFDDFIDWYYGGIDFEPTDTDWIDAVTRDAGINNFEISLSGGDAKTRYYLSGSYFDQKGIVIGSQYERYSTRLNLDHQANDRLTIGTSVQLSRSDNNRIVSDNTLYGPFANSLAASPIWPIYYDEATKQYTRPNYFYTNPVAEGTENDDITQNLRAIGNAFARYTILPGLDFQVKGGIDALNVDERRYTPTNYPGSFATSVGGSATNATATVTKVLLESTASYNKTFNDVHSISGVIGASTEQDRRKSAFVTGVGFPGERFRYVASAARVNSGSNEVIESALLSYFGRVNYNYNDRYLLGVNFRADGSTRFGEKNRFGYFPSVSAGWRVIEEEFMSGLDFMSELKLRASYGITGNQSFGDFAYRALYAGSNYLDQPGIGLIQIPNPDLKWEETQQFNVGADIGFFNNRLNIAADYYIKKTEDLLFNRPIPTQNGFGSYQSNIGSIENKGFELAINTVNIDNRDNGFSWTTDFNIAFNRNKVLELYEGQDIFYGFGGNSLVLREGEPIGTFYGFLTDGVYSTTAEIPASIQAQGTQAGDVRFVDVNGDGVITDDDLTIIGSAQPKYVGGLTNNFRFKGFDLNIFLQFSQGNDIANPAHQYQQHLGNDFLDDNMLALVKNRWQKEGDVTDVPRATVLDLNNNNRSNSSRFIYDGSYLRFKNVILGYTLPTSITERAKMRSVRIYAQAQNLFTFTDYPGFDPEVNFAGTSNTTLGVDFYTFPQTRTITFGVNVGF
ncbi:TonB-linked SusC/RagA family outer membrane protein [Pontibacter aydingkolensis]|uniref:TonB-dependent receptor n=1 Tax=Pontibacter aydingkolensis TaxID=1911536 RepID=A0ABS7CUU4_9BACT|nr:TonB-dependent receptor [Pontibacter aydingkolensis]MBW7467629.1 TonB-dependent receptor [Pontibacter aydingkolensis]